MRRITADCDHVYAGHSIEKGVDMSLAHTAQANNTDVKMHRRHFGELEDSRSSCT